MSSPVFDPAALPILDVSDRPAIDPAQLSEAWLRQCFAQPQVWEPELHGDPHRFYPDRPLVPAAVLLPIILHEPGPNILLTQRTAHLYDHAGQVSFPGGRVETGDASIIDTALRETEEEVGLAPRHIEIVGQLPDYFTASGYQVTPLVGLVRPPFDLKPDSFEVAEVFETPLAFLMNPANHQRRSVQLEQGVRIFYTMPYQRYFIWGATAAMLRNLYCFLAAQPGMGAK